MAKKKKKKNKPKFPKTVAGLPTGKALEVTQEFLELYANYVEKTEPYAVNDINALRAGMNALPSIPADMDL